MPEAHGGPEPQRRGRGLSSLRNGFTRVLLALVWAYKHLVSLPLHAVLGPRYGCRFYPSCSDFAAEALRVHGPLQGSWLSVCRLARCNPLHPGGIDFVPARGALRPRCVRTA